MKTLYLSALILVLAGSVAAPAIAQTAEANRGGGGGKRAKNIILFVGDGMGVSTVSATRVMSVGVDGNLVMDQLPYTALSRTADADHITADSASTMTSMMTGVNANSGVIGFGPGTEFGDFNKDGDTAPLGTLLEQAKQAGLKVGVVSTARITHATPAACYSHINNRDNELDIALQALPGDARYNRALGTGLDLMLGGGRQLFVPTSVVDEEGGTGARTDGRDLRTEFQAKGYRYVWNTTQFSALTSSNLPVLGLFERSHMEWEHDRPSDTGGEPSLSELTKKSIELLGKASQRGKGYFLMVESGRIDHAHHAGNAFRALTDAEELDRAIGAALMQVDLRDTLILVTADHSHVFTMAGYPLRAAEDLAYKVASAPAAYLDAPYNNLFDVVYDVDNDGNVAAAGDGNGVPYTILGYHNGPGYRGVPRVNPFGDPFLGLNNVVVDGPNHSNYLQESAVPSGSETHAGEEVALYATGPSAELVRGTVRNSHVYTVMATALGLRR